MLILKRWLPAVILMLFIFSSSGLPGATISEVKVYDAVAHKITHALLYALLCFLYYRATKNIWLSVLLTSLYGVTDEFHQLFTDTRSGNVIDVGVDSLAGFAAGIVLWKFYLVLPEKLKIWLEE